MSHLSVQEYPRSPFLPAPDLDIQHPPAKSIDDCAAMIGRYNELRKSSKSQSVRVSKLLDKSQLHEGASSLNLTQDGIFYFDCEEDAGVLFEYCMHDVWRNGHNAIRQFLAESPPPDDSVEMRLLQGGLSAVFSMFVVEKARRGVGVEVRDLIRGQRHAVVDMSLGNCGRPGMVMCGRLIEAEGITMTTGAVIGGDAATCDRAMAALERKNDRSLLLQDAPERRSAATALIIRHFLTYRRALLQSLEAESEPQRVVPVKSVPRVGRNDPCPCGSGIKYKKCCG